MIIVEFLLTLLITFYFIYTHFYKKIIHSHKIYKESCQNHNKIKESHGDGKFKKQYQY